MGEGEWGWHDMMGFGFLGWGWAIFMLLFWVAIIVGVVLLIKWLLKQGTSKTTSKKTALEILNERYARGEIDDEEYEKRKRKLLEG